MDPEAPEPAASPESAPGAAEDIALVEQVKAGRREAFDELIRKYQRQAVAVSYRLLGNTNDALEVVQDAFLKAFTSIGSLQNPAVFRGWLLRIVSNLSLNYRRGRKTRSQLPLDDILGPMESGQTESAGSEWMARTGDPVRNLAGKEMGAKLQEALKQLPDKQRQALLMFTVDGMPQKDVAEALNCSVEAVKWHVFQGRKRLKELLKDVM
jgi:RNA polymerase sigma-70 factor (ECF subfamily)